MASTLTRADVLRVAALARLELTDAEIALFTTQLAGILEYADAVQRIDTTGVPPAFDALAARPTWRDDTPEPSLARDIVLEQAPDAARDRGLFKVPKVL